MEMAAWLVPRLLMAIAIAVATHLIVSLAQTLMHWKLGHTRAGGRLFLNHVRFHHRYYARGRLTSAVYRGEDGNNTPFFLVPTALFAVGAYLLLPLDLFLVQITAAASSFYLHVLLDREYHVQGSWFARFRWFRRKQALHFAHHLNPNCNFAVIDFFWDRVLGTYRPSDSLRPVEVKPTPLRAADLRLPL